MVQQAKAFTTNLDDLSSPVRKIELTPANFPLTSTFLPEHTCAHTHIPYTHVNKKVTKKYNGLRQCWSIMYEVPGLILSADKTN